MTNKHILKCVQHHKTENLSSKKFKTSSTMCGRFVEHLEFYIQLVTK